MKLGVQIALVAFGSAMGGLARWTVSQLAARWFGTGFPWGTLIVNLVGCVFLGWFATFLTVRLVFTEQSRIQAEDLRLVLAIGFTGAFTTFSAFEFELHGMLASGNGLKGVAYLSSSVILGLIAMYLGVLLAGGK